MKKEKKESKLKKKIKEMKKTPKGKAILKLIGWVIFFFFLFLFCVIASFITSQSTTPIQEKPTDVIKEEEEVPEEMLSITMLNHLEETLINYTYHYEITINNEIYKYNGSKNNNIETGYKESSNGIIKYYIDETGIYQETTMERIPIDNLYENLDSNYFNLTNLFNLFRGIEWKLNKNHNCKNYLYEGSDSIHHYELEHDGEKVVFIKIYNENYNYYFTYEYVGGTS